VFQTEPIKLLQSFATDWLTDFLWLVTQLGYSSFYIPVVFLITFGVSFRKGFVLTQMLVWIGILTELLKNVIALPRPADVDSGVQLLVEGVPNPAPFSDMGGRGFWGLPDPEAIRLYRAQPEWSFGIPSGHVSGTTTFWGGLSLLFRNPALRAAAVLVVLLMPLSRMYLGRHFVADVLAGFLLAAVMLAIGYRLFIRPEARGRLLDLTRLDPVANGPTMLVLALSLLMPFLLLTLNPLVEPQHAGRLLGLNVAFVLLAWRGLPDDAGTPLRRAGRVAVAFGLFLGASRVLGLGIDAVGWNEDGLWTEFGAAAIPTFIALWVGMKIGLRLALYGRPEGKVPA